MKKLMLLLLVTLICSACPVLAQTSLPNNFVGAGLGFHKTGNPQTTGWLAIGTNKYSANAHFYTVLATDYFNNGSSVRAEVDKVLFKRGPIVAFGIGGAGVAIGGGPSVGGSFSGGGGFLFDIQKYTKTRSYLLGSVTRVKNDISVPVAGQFGFLKQFGDQLAVRMGFIATW